MATFLTLLDLMEQFMFQALQKYIKLMAQT